MAVRTFVRGLSSPGSRKVRHPVLASAVHDRACRPIHGIGDGSTSGVGEQVRGVERGSKDQPKGWHGDPTRSVKYWPHPRDGYLPHMPFAALNLRCLGGAVLPTDRVL